MAWNCSIRGTNHERSVATQVKSGNKRWYYKQFKRFFIGEQEVEGLIKKDGNNTDQEWNFYYTCGRHKNRFMKEGLYRIEDIHIGDEVAFQGTPAQNDYGQSWEVIGIDDSKLKIKTLEYYEPKNLWTIEINEVVGHFPLSRATKN